MTGSGTSPREGSVMQSAHLRGVNEHLKSALRYGDTAFGVCTGKFPTCEEELKESLRSKGSHQQQKADIKATG